MSAVAALAGGHRGLAISPSRLPQVRLTRASTFKRLGLLQGDLDACLHKGEVFAVPRFPVKVGVVRAHQLLKIVIIHGASDIAAALHL